MAGNRPDPVYSADGSQIIGVKHGNVIAYYNGTLPGTPYSNLYVSKNGYNLYYDDQGGVSAAPGVNPLTGKPYEKVAHVYSVEQAFTFAKALAFRQRAQEVADVGRRRGIGQNRDDLVQQFQGYADKNAKLMDEILKADPGDGRKMHQLGRSVQGYNELGGDEQAERYTRDWMAEAMLAKGYSDPVAHDAYLKSMGYKMVEASPTDHKWGAGVSLYQNEDFQNYPGANLQGELLTRVRDRIVSDEVYREHVKEDFNKRIQAVDSRYNDNSQRSFNKQAERQEQQNKASTIYYSVVALAPGEDKPRSHVFTSATEAIESLRGMQLIDYKRFKTKEYADSWASLPTDRQRKQYYELLKEAYENGTPVPKVVDRPRYPDQQSTDDSTKTFDVTNIENNDSPAGQQSITSESQSSEPQQSSVPDVQSTALDQQADIPVPPTDGGTVAEPKVPQRNEQPAASVGVNMGNNMPPKAPEGSFRQSAPASQQSQQDQDVKPKKKLYIMALTGHRPSDLTAYMGKSFTKNDKRAYNYNNKFWQAAQKDFEAIIDSRMKQHPEGLELHSGLAQGADTVWARAILKKQKEYGKNKIKFVANVPDKTQTELWNNPKVIDEYNFLLKQADNVVYGAPKGQESQHDNRNYERRNQQMILGSDETLCFYDGRTQHPYVDRNGNQRMKRSGTWNGYRDAVKNAQEYGGKINLSVTPAKIAKALGHDVKFENLPKHDQGLYAVYGNYDGDAPDNSKQDQSQNSQQQSISQDQQTDAQSRSGDRSSVRDQQSPNDQYQNTQQYSAQGNSKNGPQYPEGRNADQDQADTKYTMTAFGYDPRQAWQLLKKADENIQNKTGKKSYLGYTYNFSNAYAGRNTRSRFNLAEQKKYEALIKKRIDQHGKINVQCSFDPGTSMSFTRAAMAVKEDKDYKNKITVIGNFVGPQEFVGRNKMVPNVETDYHTGQDYDQSAAEEAKLMMNDMDKVNHYQYQPMKDGHYQIHVEQWNRDDTRTYISGSPSGFDQDFNNAEQQYAEATRDIKGYQYPNAVPDEVTDAIHHNMIDKSHEMLALYSESNPYILTTKGQPTKQLSETAQLINYAQHNPDHYDSSLVPSKDQNVGDFESERAVNVEKPDGKGGTTVGVVPMLVTDVSLGEVAQKANDKSVYSNKDVVDGQQVKANLSTDSHPEKVMTTGKDGKQEQLRDPKTHQKVWDYIPSNKRITYLEGFKTNYYNGKFSGKYNGYGPRSYDNTPSDNNNGVNNSRPSQNNHSNNNSAQTTTPPASQQPTRPVTSPQSTRPEEQKTTPQSSNLQSGQPANNNVSRPAFKSTVPGGGLGVVPPTPPADAQGQQPPVPPVDPGEPPVPDDDSGQTPIDFGEDTISSYDQSNIPPEPPLPESEDDSISLQSPLSDSQQLDENSVKATEHPGDHSVEDAAKQVKDTGKFKSKASQVNLQKQVEKQKKIQQAKRNKEADAQNTQQPKKGTKKSKSADKEFGD